MRLLAALALILLATKATADERQIRRDCTADALRYCKRAIPAGGNAIIACMVRNKSNLSEQCRRHIR